MLLLQSIQLFFFFNDTATTEIYTLSLHDALPIFKVIITKSFARIHETNLKKQGILALTFADPKDYDQIEQTDRISVVDLQNLKPGKPVKVIIHKAGGREVEIQTNHSYTEQQIAWFRAGSALNSLN